MDLHDPVKDNVAQCAADEGAHFQYRRLVSRAHPVVAVVLVTIAFGAEARTGVIFPFGEVLAAHAVSALREAAGIRIMGDPTRTVEQLQTRFSLSNDEKGSVLRALIEGADLSMWGLANAVTRIAEEATTYDRATDLESIGGQVLALPAASARELLAAA